VDSRQRARLPATCSHTRSVMKLPYTSPEMLYFSMFVHARNPDYILDSHPELVFYCTLATRTSDIRYDLQGWYTPSCQSRTPLSVAVGLDGLRVRIRPTALLHVDEILRGVSTVLADHVRRCWEERSKQASCCVCSIGVNRNHVLGGHSVLRE
jgi:hypothetical protein